MFFKDVLGHQQVKNSLRKVVSDGHVGHALYFLGPDGSGNLPLAIAFSAYILCENPNAQDRCGECSSCKQINSWSHPDFHFSFPIIKKKPNETSEEHLQTFIKSVSQDPYITLKTWELTLEGENKKSIIPTAESDYIVKALSLKSFRGGHKILIIWRADQLHLAAANKLLKTLEEPTEKTIVILVADSTESMLPTIVSRTQLVNCGSLRDEDIQRGLQDELGLDEARAANIARVSNGNYHQAKLLAQDSANTSEYLEIFSSWMRACVKHNMPEALNIIDEIAKFSKDRQQNFLEYCMEFIHKSIMFMYISKESSRFDDEAMLFAERFAPYMIQSDLEGFHDVLSHGHYMIERNVNSRLLFSKMSRDLMTLYNKKEKANH